MRTYFTRLNKNTIAIKQCGYKYEGISTIVSWDGQIGQINMDCWYSDKPISKINLVNYINDGEFGCQRIIEANVYCYECFGIDFNNCFKLLKHKYIFLEKELINCLK